MGNYKFGDRELSARAWDVLGPISDGICWHDDWHGPTPVADGNMGLSWMEASMDGFGCLADVEDDARYGGCGRVRRAAWPAGVVADGDDLPYSLLTPEDAIASDWTKVVGANERNCRILGDYTSRPTDQHLILDSDSIPVALIGLATDVLIIPACSVPDTVTVAMPGRSMKSVADVGVPDGATITRAYCDDKTGCLYLHSDRLLLPAWQSEWVDKTPPPNRPSGEPMIVWTNDLSQLAMKPLRFILADEVDKIGPL